MNRQAYQAVVEMLPPIFGASLLSVGAPVASRATEIRLRGGRPCVVISENKPVFIHNEQGNLLTLTQVDIKTALTQMCEFSLYKKEDELRHGFVTIRGGHRIGVCATHLPDGSVDLASISSISIRIAREHRGCAAGVFGETMMRQLVSVLIAGRPLSGKTTILRDLARILASDPLFHKVVLIDERGELASVSDGMPTLDIGITSDVLDGCPRKTGFDIAVRTLNPDIIFCDELGTPDDCESIAQAARSGVKVAASVHAGTLDELLARPAIRNCIDSGVFEYVVFLESYPNIGKIKQVYKVVAA